MKKSILLSMVDGYLFVCRGIDRPWQNNYRRKEAERITAKIRETFGGFDESDEQCCATVIRALMAYSGTTPPTKPTAARNPDPDRLTWEKRVIAEAQARQERDQRLQQIQWF